MGKAFTCDRCGCLFSGNTAAMMKVTRYDKGSRRKTDLCADCRKSLFDWWEKGKNDSKANRNIGVDSVN